MSEDAANDNNVPVTHSSGNVFLDLGFDADEAARAVVAMAEYHKKGGKSFEDFKAELDALARSPSPEVRE